VDSESVFLWEDGRVFCSICKKYSKLTGAKGLYSKGGALPKDEFHMKDHIMSKDHELCEKKFLVEYCVCS
jgi:hypothetical protein